MAFKCRLIGGELKAPVALIRRHEGNRIWVGQNDKTRLLLYQSFFNWVINKKISVFNLLILARKISFFQSKVLKKPFVLVFIKNSFQALIAKFKKL